MAAVPDLSRGPVLLTFSIGTATLAFSTSVARFLLQSRKGLALVADDYTIAAATVVATIGTIFSIIEGSMTVSSKALEFDVLGQPLFMMGATLAKISICLFFIRLLPGTKHWRILLSVLIFLLAVVNLIFSMTVNLQCQPLEKLWNPSVLGSCWDPSVQLSVGYFQGAFSVFSWLVLALFPVIVIRDMDLQMRLKWPFYVLSIVSFSVGIFAIVRVYETSLVGGQSVYTYNTFCAMLLSVLEQNFAIISANVLLIEPLFLKQLPPPARHIAPSRASSRKAIARSDSRASSKRSSQIDLKRTTTLIIQGPRRRSLDIADSGRESVEIYDLEEGESIRGSFDVDAWPKGIIKTVSVEVVVEEESIDHEVQRGMAGSSLSRRSTEMDWETMLRNGPENK